MASSIGTLAAYNYANMKPASGEQLDALWGQNIADSSGYNYYHEIPIPMYTNTAQLNTFFFTKRASHNGLKWVGRGQHGTSGVQISYMWVWDHTGTVAGGGAASLLNATNTVTMNSGGTQRFDMDISTLTDGVQYVFGFGGNNGPLIYTPQAVWQTYGSGATH